MRECVKLFRVVRKYGKNKSGMKKGGIITQIQKEGGCAVYA